MEGGGHGGKLREVVGSGDRQEEKAAGLEPPVTAAPLLAVCSSHGERDRRWLMRQSPAHSAWRAREMSPAERAAGRSRVGGRRRKGWSVCGWARSVGSIGSVNRHVATNVAFEAIRESR